MSGRPVQVGIIGMGGFAGVHHSAVHALEVAGECRLIGACDPNVSRFAEAMENWALAERGAQVFDDYETMLDACRADLDMAIVPTPVPLHALMHRACVERGLACYLEKPPTLYLPELEAMQEVEANAPYLTNVGFNYIIEPLRQQLKQRLLSGEFGALRKVQFSGPWPRLTTYFTRAAWAGRLFLDGRPVLDSCIGNAMAHYAHNLHFWAGQQGLYDWEPLREAQAELYRAHAIENFDTIFLRGVCENGVAVEIAASHACARPQQQREVVYCEKATITYVTQEEARIAWQDGREEVLPLPGEDLLEANLRAYFRYLRGEAARPITRLEDARPFVELIGLAYLAGGAIATIPAEQIARVPSERDEGEWLAVAGLREAMELFLETGRFPSEQGLSWGRAGGSATRDDLPRLPRLLERLAK